MPFFEFEMNDLFIITYLLATILTVVTCVDYNIKTYNFKIERLKLPGFPKFVLAINGNYIGPVVDVTVGERLQITVENLLSMEEVY